MNTRTKQCKIREVHISEEDLFTNLAKAIIYLQALQNSFKDKDNVCLGGSLMYGLDEVVLTYEELETDAEFNSRVAEEDRRHKAQQEAIAKEKTAKNYKEELAQLNKKYGINN